MGCNTMVRVHASCHSTCFSPDSTVLLAAVSISIRITCFLRWQLDGSICQVVVDARTCISLQFCFAHILCQWHWMIECVLLFWRKLPPLLGQPSFYHLLHTFLPLLPERSARVMHFGQFVCLSVRTRNSKTIAPIDLIFYTRSIIPMARSSPKMTWIGILTQEFI